MSKRPRKQSDYKAVTKLVRKIGDLYADENASLLQGISAALIVAFTGIVFGKMSKEDANELIESMDSITGLSEHFEKVSRETKGKP